MSGAGGTSTPRNRSREQSGEGGLGGAAFPDQDRAMFTEAVASAGSEEVAKDFTAMMQLADIQAEVCTSGLSVRSVGFARAG